MAFGDGRRMRAPVVELGDRRALEAWRPADDGVVEAARRLKERALLEMGMSHSAIASWLYSKCHHQIPTTALETAAVVASGDGACLLLYNPEFFVAIGAEGVRFVLFHEARHLVQRHLFADADLRSDPVFTVACEVTVNHVALMRLGGGLPEVDGRPVGISPSKVYGGYVEDLRGQGLDPVRFEEWIETDMSVYRELRRMRRPPRAGDAVCVHVLVDVLDQETVERIGNDVLRSVLIAARRGDRAAKEELLELLRRTEGGGEGVDRIWGDLGAHALRGVTQSTRRVEWWQRWLVDVLASKLREGERLVYPKKRGAVLAALGHEPMLARRGPERVKTLVIALDTSGSIPAGVVDWLSGLVGRIDGVETEWLSFDAAVNPFRPGEPMYGGGGTDFGAIQRHVETKDQSPDAVIVVTDGYADPIRPAEPEKWIWLITPGGDEWPERRDPPMACHRVRPA
ncbi:hypothetical protein FXF65_01175 [Actinomadura syzygii]|uniref:Putative metallopeptidase domain-containing protein n=2 Tax=Actinomadura syzygii TaxID=1427538 RepID=A0A5D0ULC2_9ACTN|nr:hypothetical protein FXF65_01175 [Actinomadura syzygii]